MRKFRLVCVVCMVIASACNKSEVITITVEDHYRAATDASSHVWSTVKEYTPAPGQFINETKTGGFTGEESTSADAVKYAEGRLKENKFVSLGGFGGYIVVGFDHSVDNTTGYDSPSVATPSMARPSPASCGYLVMRMVMALPTMCGTNLRVAIRWPRRPSAHTR